MEKIKLSRASQWLGFSFQGADIEFSSVSTDTRTLKPGALFVALTGENFDGHNFIAQAQAQGAVAVMVDRAVSTTLPTLKVSDTLLGLGQLATHYRSQFKMPMVAMTGSSGKTTTKEMTACILKQVGTVLATQGNLNNAIGVPLTLLDLSAKYNFAVIEMGANHAGEIAYTAKIAKPNISLITNVAPAHLQGFGSIEGVAQAKGEIYNGLPEDGVAVVNIDDQFAAYWRKIIGTRGCLTFGLQTTADFFATNLQKNQLCNYQFILHCPLGETVIQLPLAGLHNVHNALAAAAATFAAGAKLEHIQQGLASMQPVKGRLMRLAGKLGMQLLDDTYNANPGSVRAALEVLAGFTVPKVLVLGDMGELGEYAEHYHQQIGSLAKELGIDRLYAYGKLTRLTVDSFGANGYHFANREQLIEALVPHLQPEMTVLVKGSRSAKMEEVVAALMEHEIPVNSH